MQNNPTVVVYHVTNSSLGHSFANIGWAGCAISDIPFSDPLSSPASSFVGSVTGYSSAPVGISEKVGDNNTFSQTSRIGIPFHVRSSPPELADDR